MKKTFGIIVFLSLPLWQVTFMPLFTCYGAKPDLTLLGVISLGLLWGYKAGMLWGAAGGVLLAMLTQSHYPGCALFYGAAGYLAGWLKERLFTVSAIFPLGITLVLSYLEVWYFIARGHNFLNWYAWFSLSLSDSAFILYNMLLILPLFYLMRAFWHETNIW